MTQPPETQPSDTLIRRLKGAWHRVPWEIVAILVLIAAVLVLALALLQGQVSEVLSTVSHSV